jgi:hypothetical protein
MDDDEHLIFDAQVTAHDGNVHVFMQTSDHDEIVFFAKPSKVRELAEAFTKAANEAEGHLPPEPTESQ